MSSSAVQHTEVPLPPLRLMLDIEHERASARLRLSAAVVAALGGVWLAWVDDSLWMRAFALASVLFAGRFVASYRKTRRLGAGAAQYLEITPEGVTLGQGEQVTRSTPFERVARIELDEDKIAVVLCLDDGEELALEPVYGGLGLRELAETLHRYSAGRPGLGCTERNP